MTVLVPGVQKAFHLSSGATLFSAIVVLTIMILPYIIQRVGHRTAGRAERV